MSELRCPVCDRQIDPKASADMPFCSKRCRQIDLGRWLQERYGMPYERPFDVDEPMDPPDDRFSE